MKCARIKNENQREKLEACIAEVFANASEE